MIPSDSIVLSVVLPAKDEAANVGPLLRGIAAALAGVEHEIVLVDDGSGDGTAEAALALRPGLPQVRVLRHERSCGQSAALRTGILAARGAVIATLDADGQNPAAELPRLVGPLLAPGASPTIGLVQGQRKRRQDTWSRRAASWLANTLRQAMLRDGVRDSGCGLKAFRREVYLALPFFDHIHRFMPALVRREGYEILLMEVDHADRRAGQSKYSNLGRALVGIVDLAGVAWLLRRRKMAKVQELS